MNKRFVVIGLGILGNSVAKNLVSAGVEVVAIDESMAQVNAIKDIAQLAVQCDATDREALAQLGVRDADAAMMCIGEGFEAAVLVTANLLDLGVKRVAVRANNEMMASILKRIGAHDVFFVESEMGKVIAHRLHQPSILHEMDLGDGFRILQSKTPQAMVGKTLADLALPKNFGVQLVAVRDLNDSQAIRLPSAETLLSAQDLLVICGSESNLSKLFETYRLERA